MAANHNCANCGADTTADSWLCYDCTAAVSREVAGLDGHPSFSDMDEARQRALARRQQEVRC